MEVIEFRWPRCLRPLMRGSSILWSEICGFIPEVRGLGFIEGGVSVNFDFNKTAEQSFKERERERERQRQRERERH